MAARLICNAFLWWLVDALPGSMLLSDRLCYEARFLARCSVVWNYFLKSKEQGSVGCALRWIHSQIDDFGLCNFLVSNNNGGKTLSKCCCQPGRVLVIKENYENMESNWKLQFKSN